MNRVIQLLRNPGAVDVRVPADAIVAPRSRVKFRFIPTVPLIIIGSFVFIAVFANFLAPYDPTEVKLRDSMIPPIWAEGGTSEHWLGTDFHGRDQLTRLFFGARVSLSVSALTMLFSITIGVFFGLISGYFGGKLDVFVMRVVDISLAYPPILIAIVLAVIFGPSFGNVILIIVLVYWSRVARIIRGEALALKGQDFVTLASLAGASHIRIMLKHILPGVIPSILVLATLELGSVVLFEASLSFLGVGIPPPNPSWGVMVSDGRGQINTGWWLSLFPGLAILLLVLSFNQVGDWLRDRADPRLQQL